MKSPRLLTKYQKKIIPALQKEWHLSNALAIPRIEKIVISAGITDEQHRDQALKNMSEQMALFTGQKPIITKAKKSIAAFNLRAGDPVGIKVTLRRYRLYEFFDKLISIVLPRVKDFQGTRKDAFDGQGNYNFGLTEQIVFPEVDYDKIDKVRGLEITIVTTAAKDEQARKLLELFGFPFEKDKK